MKNLTTIIFFLVSFFSFAQTPPAELQNYYSGVDFSKTGLDLKTELGNHTTLKHTRILIYSPEVWEALKVTDQDPDNANNILLVYGYNDTDGNIQNDRSRNKFNNGGNVGNWNREHTYPKSLGSPNLGTTGPGADALMLRPCDVQWNGQRGSKRFASGSGNSGNSNGGWYPGDEWKGDIARMMMYMYIRYGDRCRPSSVGNGSSVSTGDAMIDLFLEWNAQDPVSDFEYVRNDYHEVTTNPYAQGNRNPFIDNPYLATKIWGGTPAEDKWFVLNTNDFYFANTTIYPNPTNSQNITVETGNEVLISKIDIITPQGQVIKTYLNKKNSKNITLDTGHLKKGIVFLRISSGSNYSVRKIIIN